MSIDVINHDIFLKTKKDTDYAIQVLKALMMGLRVTIGGNDYIMDEGLIFQILGRYTFSDNGEHIKIGETKIAIENPTVFLWNIHKFITDDEFALIQTNLGLNMDIWAKFEGRKES